MLDSNAWDWGIYIHCCYGVGLDSTTGEDLCSAACNLTVAKLTVFMLRYVCSKTFVLKFLDSHLLTGGHDGKVGV